MASETTLSPRYRPFLLLFVFVPLLLLISRLDWVGHFGDDAAFVGVAKGMSTWSGYAGFQHPDLIPETKHPPGYPLLLLPALWLGMGKIGVFQAVTALFGMGSLVLLWQHRVLGPPAAGLLLANFYWLLFCQHIMSDVPYAFSLLLMGLLLRDVEPGRGLEPRLRITLSLVLGFSVLLRSIGLVVIPIVCFVLWLRKVPLLQWLPVPFYAAAAALPYYVFSAVSGYRQDVVGYPGVWTVLKTNLVYYLQCVPFLAGVSSVPVSLTQPAWAVAALLLLATGTYGGYLAFRKGLQFEALVTLAIAGVTVVWPFQDVRLLVPTIPFFLLFLLEGGAEALNRAGAMRPHRWVFLGLLAAELLRLGPSLLIALRSQPPYARPAILSALDKVSKPGDVLVADDQGVWLQCGTLVAALPPEGKILKLYEVWMEQMAMVEARFLLLPKELDRGRSLSMGETRSSSEPKLQKTLLNLPDAFHLVAENEHAMLFELTVDWKKERQAAGWFRLGHQKFFTEKSGAEEFRKALALDPAFPVARFFLANLLLQQGKTREAVAELETLLRYQPYFDDAAALLGQVRSGPRN